MVKVKICGLTRSEDVEAAIEAGADALGFVLEPSSPRFVGARASELIRAVEPYIPCIGVFGQFHSTDIENLNAVQLVDLGGATPMLSSVGLSRMPPVIKAVRMKPGTDPSLALKFTEDWFQQFHLDPRGILLDAYDETRYGGTGTTIDWRLAAEFVRLSPRKVILAGGLTPNNVAEAIEAVRPYAVDVSSGVEETPGKKDRARIRDFVQSARSVY